MHGIRQRRFRTKSLKTCASTGPLLLGYRTEMDILTEYGRMRISLHPFIARPLWSIPLDLIIPANFPGSRANRVNWTPQFLEGGIYNELAASGHLDRSRFPRSSCIKTLPLVAFRGADYSRSRKILLRLRIPPSGWLARTAATQCCR